MTGERPTASKRSEIRGRVVRGVQQPVLEHTEKPGENLNDVSRDADYPSSAGLTAGVHSSVLLSVGLVVIRARRTSGR